MFARHYADKKPNPLRAVAIENSPMILANRQVGGCVFDEIQKYWTQKMPDWFPLQAWIMDASLYSPISRHRVFLVSVPRLFQAVYDAVSEATGQFGGDRLPFFRPEIPVERPSLHDYLTTDLHGFDEGLYITPKMKKNLDEWMQLFNAHFYDNPSVCVGCVDIGRNPGKDFSRQMRFDQMISLTTTNRYIALLPGRSCKKVPAGGRLLTVHERARIMGFDADVLLRSMSPSRAIIALGNTIVVGVCEAVLRTILQYLDKVHRISMEQAALPPKQVALHPAPTGCDDDLAEPKRRKVAQEGSFAIGGRGS